MGLGIVIKDRAGRLGALSRIEEKLFSHGYRVIVGVDEAGRGPLAGPVVAAAVILPEGVHIQGLDDSKKLSAARRDLVFDRIVSSSAIYAVAIVDNEVIDRINILRASLNAMAQAVGKLRNAFDLILVDGNQIIPGLSSPQMAVVGGDAICPCISAASILAKVTRDRIMDHYAAIYPRYAFDQHRGYPTTEHLRKLREYGPTPIHRRTFRPVQEVLTQRELQLAQ